ncbi:MAG TPA: Sua5/YciO/YrdC/YwlC family protein [Campylobacterales bacterium]|nr:Sua5/YciO/YrdC/YwlC family protein [Campylobacterales bacterium]
MDPNKIYLVQTDTTVGLVSQNKEALKAAKQRDDKKPFIITCAGLKELKTLARIPKKHKKTVRRAQKTTFVYPRENIAIRAIHEGDYHEFLKPFGWMYSTSANETGKAYDIEFAKNAADEVIGDAQNLKERAPSKIIKLGKRQKKLR